MMKEGGDREFLGERVRLKGGDGGVSGRRDERWGLKKQFEEEVEEFLGEDEGRRGEIKNKNSLKQIIIYRNKV